MPLGKLQVRIGAIVLGLAVSMGISGSQAGELNEFQGLIAKANSHYRISVNYLRTGNVDFAAIELEGMIANWKKLDINGRDEFPDPYEGDPDIRRTLQDIGGVAELALSYIDEGKPEQAHKLIKPIRSMLHNLRVRNGFYGLEDCLYDASRNFGRLYAYKDEEPDFALSGDGARLIGYAAITAERLKQCDGMAADKISKNEEFRRLIDGATSSLARVPEAVETEDNALLHRLLIELKSFDRLLFFRYG